VGAGGSGASQAGAPAGAGGEGASGGAPSAGGGPSIWTQVGLPDVGSAAGPVPNMCANGGPRVTLFGGTIQAACVPCKATPTDESCRTDLRCSTSNACTNPAIVSVGFACSDIGVFNSCGTSALSEAACTLTGGEVTGATGFDRFASFCPTDGAESSCSIAEGNLGASACAATGRRFAYALRYSAEVSAECSACSANPSCSGPVFRLGRGDCSGFETEELGAPDCAYSGPNLLGFSDDWTSAVRLDATKCNPTETSLTTTPEGEVYTVCCSAPLPPEFDPQKLPPPPSE
jgi:hypothetical protein